MQTQIRLSSLILAGLISIGLVAVLVLLRPPMTQVYCMQLLGLTAGAGLIVTVYNCVMTARMRRRSAAAPIVLVQEEHAEDTAVHADAQGTAEQEMLPSVLPDEDADALPESLDALLDAAYEAAAQEPMRAVAAYRRALARYPNDSYMPYLIIELSTLYKRMGDYDAALALFDETLALPIVAKNAVVVQEFQRSRRSLDAVSAMLAARGTPALPYGEVPKELLAEADRRADEQTTSDI